MSKTIAHRANCNNPSLGEQLASSVAPFIGSKPVAGWHEIVETHAKSIDKAIATAVAPLLERLKIERDHYVNLFNEGRPYAKRRIEQIDVLLAQYSAFDSTPTEVNNSGK